MAKIDWIIHLCANGAPCDKCGKVENGFFPKTCNAHTHGMEKYHHMDFQLVLALPVKKITRIGYATRKCGMVVFCCHKGGDNHLITEC